LEDELAVHKVLQGGEPHFLDLVGQIRSPVGLAQSTLAGADEFAHLGNGDNIVVDDGCDAVNDLGLLRLKRGNSERQRKTGGKNCGKRSHRLCIVSRKLNTPRSLKFGSGTVKRGNLPPINT
jgi:UDP-N-acetylenolpyruvoylglucosamine reductase